MTLAAHCVQPGRDGNGLQCQRCGEQGISLCFSKIAVCDADYEVKMKDVLRYVVFFFPSLNTSILYGGRKSERQGWSFWLVALGKQKIDPAALLCRSRKLNGNKPEILKQKRMEENHVSCRVLLLLGVVVSLGWVLG